jgi:hypothetical protein
MYTHSEIDDRANLVLNVLHTDTSWTWNGSIVTSYDSGGYVAYHREATNTGWNPHNVYNVLSSGCAGCSSATIHAHAEFSYQGVFDPSGTLFYDILDNYPTVYNNGVWACNLTLYARHYSGAWKSWIKTCGNE